MCVYTRAVAVPGAAAGALLLAGVAGAGAVRVRRGPGGGWSAARDTPRSCCTHLLLFLLSCGLLASVVVDIARNTHGTGVIGIKYVIEVVQLVQVVTLVWAGVRGARARTDAVIRSLDYAHKVQVKYNNGRWFEKLNKKAAIILGVTIYSFYKLGKCIYDVYEQMNNFGLKRARGVRPLSALCHTLTLLVTVALSAQFVVSALSVSCALSVLVRAVAGLLCLIDLHTVPNISCLSSGLLDYSMISATSISSFVDNMNVQQLAAHNGMENLEVDGVDEVDAVDELGRVLADAVSAAEDLERAFQWPLALIFFNFLLFMIISPYMLVVLTANPDATTFNYIDETADMMLHLVYMLVCVEPGYQYQRETQQLRRVLGEASARCPSRAARRLRTLRTLHTLPERLQIPDRAYSLLGLTNLSRTLIPTILATSITFSVLLVQFYSTNTDM